MWIEDSEKVCAESGVIFPVPNSKSDTTNPATLFVSFPPEEEPRRVPRPPQRPSITLPPFAARALASNVRLLDLIRPLLARRNAMGEDDDEEDADRRGRDLDDDDGAPSSSRPRRFIGLDDVVRFLFFLFSFSYFLFLFLPLLFICFFPPTLFSSLLCHYYFFKTTY